ncbi:hypothetical protein XELAEV_18017336mg [Xenopus laevis]|uniref:Uncharacterized protein n=1 Tax=Xenopus laevis TaxID=8355 RepID=A0A974DCZ1_XENLA|nr:hypothetical protein XELAEV_18017336mg [Xenopus laevis]
MNKPNNKYNKPTMIYDEMVTEWATWHIIVVKSMLVKELGKETFLSNAYFFNSSFIFCHGIIYNFHTFFNKTLK